MKEEAIPGISALKPEGAFYLFVDVSGLYGKGIRGAENRIGSGFCIHFAGKEICGCCALCRFRHAGLYPPFYATSMELIKKAWTESKKW